VTFLFFALQSQKINKDAHYFWRFFMSSHASNESMSHEHHHHHDPEHMKAIVNRLSKAIGHLESVKKMVEDDRDCTEVLVQLAAVRSAINNCGKEILKEHMSHCIVHAVQDGDEKAISDLNEAVDKFMKNS
jgi:DNA-binding FrmR family transcriptional regulator